MKQWIPLLLCLAALSSCHRAPRELEPALHAPRHPKEVQRETRCFLNLPDDFSLSPFSPLTREERKTDWGKEFIVAEVFAEDFDLFRAITGFKRALCFEPPKERRLQIEYAIALAYYLGQKYTEVIYMVESTELCTQDSTFPAYFDLIVILYDSYMELGKCQHAEHMLRLIEEQNPEAASKFTLLETLKRADFEEISHLDERYAYIDPMMDCYHLEAKSIAKAEMLSLFPGAGYWYVGQKQTAVTAFLVNALFISASALFIHNGNVPAAVITLSLETGWYFGGIYGAGLAAKCYNEQLYCRYAEKVTAKESPYPFMMLKYTF